jgi:hypothetical protein
MEMLERDHYFQYSVEQVYLQTLRYFFQINEIAGFGDLKSEFVFLIGYP